MLDLRVLRLDQFVSGDFADSSAYGGEPATRKVEKKAKKKVKKKQVTQKPVSRLQHWKGGEDVRARTRCGRASGPPVRLDLSCDHPTGDFCCVNIKECQNMSFSLQEL